MGKKSKGGKRKGKKLDADLDKAVDHYEPSDSDDGFETEDKILLERAKHGRLIKDVDSEEEVFRIHSSSDEEEEKEEYGNDDNEEDDEKEDDYYGGGVGSDFDSDIEGKGETGGNLPSDKAWGKKKHKYYNTDYVDQDYGGFGKDEEEEALMEEKEADAIQRRLLSHLEGTDFTLGLLDKVEQKKAEIVEKEDEFVEKEKIQTDFAKLSIEEKAQFLKQESPELFPLINDFKDRMSFAKEKIAPVLKLVETNVVPECQAAECLRLQYKIIMKYCMNVGFYLFLKSRRLRVDNHPVMQKIYTFRKLLEELDSANKEVLLDQIEKILAVHKNGGELTVISEEPEPQPKNRAEKRKRMLKLLERKKELEEMIEEKKRKFDLGSESLAKDIASQKLVKEVRFVEPSDESDGSESEGEESGHEMNQDGDATDTTKAQKRAINFKIAKNKGLTPRRKKEQRNPRVKHRNKFRKAKIRRKGQVREVRKELEKYGGEVSGIKAYVSKSIKLK